jgi:Xaa-Pro aminopeptidase
MKINVGKLAFISDIILGYVLLTLRMQNVILVAGMVFALQPWYYNHDKGISVFTEDEILVTEQGAEVLTKAMPRAPKDIEV